MGNWFDRAQDELEAAYDRGDLTLEQLRAEQRELRNDLRAEAEEAAERAYNDTIGGW